MEQEIVPPLSVLAGHECTQIKGLRMNWFLLLGYAVYFIRNDVQLNDVIALAYRNDLAAMVVNGAAYAPAKVV